MIAPAATGCKRMLAVSQPLNTVIVEPTYQNREKVRLEPPDARSNFKNS
jgi:hypothetical protein